MGTRFACGRCLPAKIRNYAPNAQNGAVTVTIIKNPPQPAIRDEEGNSLMNEWIEWLRSLPECDFCGTRAEFATSIYSKK